MRFMVQLRVLDDDGELIADDIKSNLVLVAELDRSIVGGLILVLEDEYAMLANVAVDPDRAGMGIGRGLIEYAELQCRRLKKGELRLSTHIAMLENVSLYEHLGWKEMCKKRSEIGPRKRLDDLTVRNKSPPF